MDAVDAIGIITDLFCDEFYGTSSFIKPVGCTGIFICLESNQRDYNGSHRCIFG